MSGAYAILRNMPDNDFLPRGVRRPWRKAAELALGLHDPGQLADTCGKALAAEIRTAELGAPLVRLAEELHAAASAEDYARLRAAEADFRRDVASVPLTTAIINECERLFELSSSALTAESPADTHHLLVERALRHHTNNALFGSEQMLTQMHRQAALSCDDVGAYRVNVINAAPVDHFARALFENPDRPVRAPAATVRASTADMLGEEVR